MRHSVDTYLVVSALLMNIFAIVSDIQFIRHCVLGVGKIVEDSQQCAVPVFVDVDLRCSFWT